MKPGIFVCLFLLSALRCAKAPGVWVDPNGDGIITDREEIEELQEDGYVNYVDYRIVGAESVCNY